jgi:hypothetical protein
MRRSKGCFLHLTVNSEPSLYGQKSPLPRLHHAQKKAAQDEVWRGARFWEETPSGIYDRATGPSRTCTIACPARTCNSVTETSYAKRADPQNAPPLVAGGA